jgi:hypothetical protein
MENNNSIESQNQEDFEMAQYIYSILSTQIFVVMSWGFENPVTIRNGMKFKVSGFKFQGDVKIVYNKGQDLFDIAFINSKNERHTLLGIYFDQLLEVVDDFVEKTEKYKELVQQTYFNSHTEKTDE